MEGKGFPLEMLISEDILMQQGLFLIPEMKRRHLIPFVEHFKCTYSIPGLCHVLSKMEISERNVYFHVNRRLSVYLFAL